MSHEIKSIAELMAAVPEAILLERDGGLQVGRIKIGRYGPQTDDAIRGTFYWEVELQGRVGNTRLANSRPTRETLGQHIQDLLNQRDALLKDAPEETD